MEDTIRIALTDKQQSLLRGKFKQVEDAFWSGKPGVLVGQFCEESVDCAYFEVGFIEHEKALEITKGIPVRSGNKPSIERDVE